MPLLVIALLPLLLGLVSLRLGLRGWRNAWRDRALARAFMSAPQALIAAGRGLVRLRARVRTLNPPTVEDASGATVISAKEIIVVRYGRSETAEGMSGFFKVGDPVQVLGSMDRATVEGGFRGAPTTEPSIVATDRFGLALLHGDTDIDELYRATAIRCWLRIAAAIAGVLLIVSVPATAWYLLATAIVN